MSFKDAIQEHARTVFLNQDHFAEQITHRRGGDPAQDVTVTAVVCDEEAVDMPEPGDAQRFTREIEIAEATEVSRGDQWVIGGLVYQTEKTPAGDGRGLRKVGLTRTETHVRARPRAVR